jgi:hypothetical protein
MPNLPPIRRVPPPPPDPREVRIKPNLIHPPLELPRRPAPDAIAARRARADRLCLWIACGRVVCRESRHCRGARAACVFELPDVRDPLL